MAYRITEKCIGCSACAIMCPVYAVSGNKGEQHNINNERCVDCGVCGRVCPKGAINNQKEEPCALVNRKKWLKPVIDRKECSACSMCVLVCTKDALSISFPQFRGDLKVYAQLSAPNKCVGCSLCEKECPMGAIRMEVSDESS